MSDAGAHALAGAAAVFTAGWPSKAMSKAFNIGPVRGARVVAVVSAVDRGDRNRRAA